MKGGRTRRAWLAFAALTALLLVLAESRSTLTWCLAALFPGRPDLLYPRAGLSYLLGEHVALTLASSALAVVVGIGFGIAATRRRGSSLAVVADRLAAVGQTFPPAAVLALSVPALGFGFAPALAALFLYSVLPILRNTMGGLEGVDADALDAARGMGMGPGMILLRVELPLALPVILAGIRTSVIVNIGTATIGATIGAGGLGAPIISGLVNQNPAYLAEGTAAVALLALAADALFTAIEQRH